MRQYFTLLFVSVFCFFISTGVQASTFTALTSGDWSNPAIWDAGYAPTLGDGAYIKPGVTVTITTNVTDVGNILIDGTLQVETAGRLTTTGITINTTGLVNNFGKISTGALDGSGAGKYINAADSYLLYKGTPAPMATNGLLVCTATGNIVEYSNIGSGSILDINYCNLLISAGTQKIFNGSNNAIFVAGNLSVTGIGTLLTSDNNTDQLLTVAGSIFGNGDIKMDNDPGSGGSSLFVNGDFLNTGTLTIASGATITYYGASPQQLKLDGNYDGILILKGGSKIISGYGNTVNNDFYSTASSLILDPNNDAYLTINGNYYGSGLLDMSGPVDHIVTLNGPVKSCFTNLIAGYGEIDYNYGSGVQTVCGGNYYNLALFYGGNTLPKVSVGEITVSGSAYMYSAVLSLNGYNLWINDPATLSSSGFGNSNKISFSNTGSNKLYVRGNTAARFGNLILPIGFSGTDYQAVTINGISGTVASGAYIGIRPVATTLGATSVNRMYDVTTSGLSAISMLDASFPFKSSEVNGTPNRLLRELAGLTYNVPGSGVTLTGVAGQSTVGGFSLKTTNGNLLDGRYYVQGTILIPTITGFAPLKGVAGAPVTINGANFNATAANNFVFFGATQATVTTASATQLVVVVPTGATYSPIVVLDVSSGLLAYSNNKFTPIFSPGKGTMTGVDFDPKVDISVGSGNYPVAVVFADFDNDGKADMATANQSSNTVSIFRNTGSAGTVSYAAPVSFSTASGPSSLAVGDVDGDGKPDLVTANLTSNTISILRNTSSGAGNIAFATSITPSTLTYPISVAIADMDGDGKADLVVATQTNYVLVYLNTGSVGHVGFASYVNYTTGTTPFSVAIGDVDGDGKPDVVVANTNGPSVSVLRNTSSVGSLSFAAKTDFAVGTQPSFVAMGDIDGDGKLDVATTSNANSSISVLRNTSSIGTLGFATNIDYAVTTNAVGLGFGDLDGDGKIDVAVANSSNPTVTVFHNASSAGTINLTTGFDLSTGNYPGSVATGDVDGDGKADLAVTNGGDNTISVIRNNPLMPPSVTGFAPAPASAGTEVTLTGTDFTGVTAVSFGGVAAASYTVNSATSLTAIVGAGAGGNISVSNSAGTGTLAGFVFATTTPLGNRGIYFDGVDDNLSLGTIPSSSAVTIEFWYKFLDANTASMFHNLNGTQTAIWLEGSNSGMKLSLGYDGGRTMASYSFSYPLNKWAHIAVVYDSPNATIYVNGVSIGTQYLGTGPVNTSGSLTFNNYSGYAHKSEVDEIRLYNSARTVSEITADMGSTSANGALGYWDFEEPNGNTVYDVSGNSSNGTLNNGSLRALRVTDNTDNAAAGLGSLRQAINDANTDADMDYIDFSIQQGNTTVVSTITPTVELTVTQPVIIDGYSAYGATPNTNSFLLGSNASLRVECDFHLLPGPSTTPYFSGINISGTSNSLVKGLSLYSITSAAGSQYNIALNNSTNSVVEGCYIGLRADGSAPSGISMVNLGIGGGSLNTIGGTALSAFNVVSYAIYDGMQISGANNFIAGNFVGTDITGNVALPNYARGITINTSGNKVYNNLSSGNGSHGIHFQLGANNGEVKGNYIGIKASLTGGMPNGNNGIFISDNTNNVTIGGISTGEPNTVAYNSNFGILIDGSYNNIVLGNNIFNNSNGGIVLTNGGNYDKAAPIILLANPSVISGVCSTSDVVGIFNDSPQSGTTNQGRTFLGNATVTGSSWSYKGSFNLGDRITATATDFANGTSAFSAAKLVATSIVPTITGFSPAKAFPGQSVVINGGNFNTTAGLNKVMIGNVACPVTAASATELTITVPKGIAYDNISVYNTATNLSGTSTAYFTPLFIGSNTITGNSLSAKADYASGSQPRSVVVGDLNNDGFPDLANVNTGNNTLSVYLNNGNGTYLAKTDYATGASPESMVLADVNGDNNLDLLCTNYSSTTFRVFLNNGNGTFSAGVDYSTLVYPWGIAAGDINGDGWVDVVVTSYITTGKVSVFLNNGDGTYGVHTDYTASANPIEITIGDLNNDKYADLAVTDQTSYVSVYLNTGSGTYPSTATVYAVGATPGNTVFGDFNGDGWNDMSVANFGSNTISVLMNNGNGTFATKTDYGTAASPRTLSAGDLNGDGLADLAVTNYAANSASIFMNKGSGLFANKVDFTTNSSPLTSQLYDLNADGRADLVVDNNASNSLSVYLNENTISFTPTIGGVGALVSISGTNLDSVTGIAFNGVNSSFSILSSSLILATVPGGATTGQVAAYNSYYTATGPNFSVPLTGIFRTKSSGVWSNVSIWELSTNSGASFFNASNYPGQYSAGDMVSITGTHQINLTNQLSYAIGALSVSGIVSVAGTAVSLTLSGNSFISTDATSKGVYVASPVYLKSQGTMYFDNYASISKTTGSTIEFQNGLDINSSGTLNLPGDVLFTTNNQTISGASGTYLYLGNTSVVGAITVSSSKYNIQFAGSLTGTNAASTFELLPGSATDYVAVQEPMQTGILISSTPGTNFWYVGPTQNVKAGSGQVYNNLKLSGSGIKLVKGNLIANTAELYQTGIKFDNTVATNVTFNGFTAYDWAGRFIDLSGTVANTLYFAGSVNDNYGTNPPTSISGGALSTVTYGQILGVQPVLSGTYANLAIEGGGIKNIVSAVGVSQSIQLNGAVLSVGGTNTITMQPTASITGSVSFGSSNMVDLGNSSGVTRNISAMSNLVGFYPIGYSGKYTPVNVTAASSGGLGGGPWVSLSPRAHSSSQPYYVASELAIGASNVTLPHGISFTFGFPAGDVTGLPNEVVFNSSVLGFGTVDLANHQISVTGFSDNFNASVFAAESTPPRMFRTNTASMVWSNISGWDLSVDGGTNWAVSSIYPGQNSGVEEVVVQAGHDVVLDVSPAYRVGATTIAGSLQLSTYNISFSGSLWVVGTLDDNSSTGTNIFKNKVIITNTGTWSATGNPIYIFEGNFRNNGTFNSGYGNYYFNTSPQSIIANSPTAFSGTVYLNQPVTVSGTDNISFSQILLGSGVRLTNQANTAITYQMYGSNAASEWYNDAGALLNIAFPYANGVPMATGIINATTTGNTVAYSSGALMKGAGYYNLSVTGGSGSILNGPVTVLGDFIIDANCSVQSSSSQITGNATGTLKMYANSYLSLGVNGYAASVQFPTLFQKQNISLDPTSTVLYTDLGNQTISGVPVYGNLSLSSGSANVYRDLVQNTSVAGMLTINTVPGYTHTLRLNNYSLTVDGFVYNDGTISFNGTVPNLVYFKDDLSGIGTIDMLSGANPAHVLQLEGVNNNIGSLNMSNTNAKVVYSRAGDQNMATGFTYTNLEVSGGGKKSLVNGTSGTTVSNNLLLNGAIIELSSFTLSVMEPGSVTGIIPFSATNCIQNNSMPLARYFTSLGVKSFVFPIGTAGTYTPMTLSGITLTTPGIVAVRSEANQPNIYDNTQSIYRDWAVTGDFSGGKMIFQYDVADDIYGLSTSLTGIHGAYLVSSTPSSQWNVNGTVDGVGRTIAFNTYPAGMNSVYKVFTAGLYGAFFPPASYYRSIASGSWGNPANWEVSNDNGVNFFATGYYPAQVTAGDVVSITGSHNITTGGFALYPMNGLTVSGALAHNTGNVSIAGATLVQFGGGIKLSSGAYALFGGKVTCNSLLGSNAGSLLEFQNGLENNATNTSNIGGILFSTNNQSISGTGSLNFQSTNVTISGPIKLTQMLGTMIYAGLDGTDPLSTFEMGPGAVLDYTMANKPPMNTGRVVATSTGAYFEYIGNPALVKPASYYSLSLLTPSSTLLGSTLVLGNLNINSTSLSFPTTVTTLDVRGNIGNTGSATINMSGGNAAHVLSVTGSTSGSSIVPGLGKVVYNGTMGYQYIAGGDYYDLYLTGGTTKVADAVGLGIYGHLYLDNAVLNTNNTTFTIYTYPGIVSVAGFGPYNMILGTDKVQFNSLDGTPTSLDLFFPVGPSPGVYRPLEFNLSSINASGSYVIGGIQKIASLPLPYLLDSTKALDQFWYLGSSGVNNVTGTITGYYNSSDVSGTESQYLGALFDPQASNWSFSNKDPRLSVNTVANNVNFVLNNGTFTGNFLTAGAYNAFILGPALYRSVVATGNWSSPASWEVWTGAGFASAANYNSYPGKNNLSDIVSISGLTNIAMDVSLLPLQSMTVAGFLSTSQPLTSITGNLLIDTDNSSTKGLQMNASASLWVGGSFTLANSGALTGSSTNVVEVQNSLYLNTSYAPAFSNQFIFSGNNQTIGGNLPFPPNFYFNLSVSGAIDLAIDLPSGVTMNLLGNLSGNAPLSRFLLNPNNTVQYLGSQEPMQTGILVTSALGSTFGYYGTSQLVKANGQVYQNIVFYGGGVKSITGNLFAQSASLDGSTIKFDPAVATNVTFAGFMSNANANTFIDMTGAAQHTLLLNDYVAEISATASTTVLSGINSKVEYNTANVTGYDLFGGNYNALVVNGPSQWNLSGNMSVNNLSVTGGATLWTKDNAINGTTTGTMLMGANTNLLLGNVNTNGANFPTGFTRTNISLDPSSTVVYQANVSTSTVSGVPVYGHLSLLGGSAKPVRSLDGNTTVLGTLNVASNCTFDLASSSLTVAGIATIGGVFMYGSSVANTVYLQNNLYGLGGISLGSAELSHRLYLEGAVNNIATISAAGSDARVVYNRVGDQSMATANYMDLEVTGGGSKTFPDTGVLTYIWGDLYMNGAEIGVLGTGYGLSFGSSATIQPTVPFGVGNMIISSITGISKYIYNSTDILGLYPLGLNGNYNPITVTGFDAEGNSGWLTIREEPYVAPNSISTQVYLYSGDINGVYSFDYTLGFNPAQVTGTPTNSFYAGVPVATSSVDLSNNTWSTSLTSNDLSVFNGYVTAGTVSPALFRATGGEMWWSDAPYWEVSNDGGNTWSTALYYPGAIVPGDMVLVTDGNYVYLDVDPNLLSSMTVTGTLELAYNNLSVTGNTLIDGSLSRTSGYGNALFNGEVYIAPTGNFSDSENYPASTYEFRNGLNINGTGFSFYSPLANMYFTTNNQTITGLMTGNSPSWPNIIVDGIELVDNLNAGIGTVDNYGSITGTNAFSIFNVGAFKNVTFGAVGAEPMSVGVLLVTAPGATFTYGAYDYTVPQYVKGNGQYYENLVITGYTDAYGLTRQRIFSGDIQVKNLYLYSGTLAFDSTVPSSLTVSGSYYTNFDPNALDMSGGNLPHQLYLDGYVSHGTSLTQFMSGTNSVVYYRGGDQEIMPGVYNSLVITGTGTKLLTDYTVVENLTVSGGNILDCQDEQIEGSATGQMQMGAGTTLILGSAASDTLVDFPQNFVRANISLDPTSTVKYTVMPSAAYNQIVSGEPIYGNLVLEGSGHVKLLGGTTTVAGYLNMIDGHLDMFQATQFDVLGNTTIGGVYQHEYSTNNCVSNFYGDVIVDNQLWLGNSTLYQTANVYGNLYGAGSIAFMHNAMNTLNTYNTVSFTGTVDLSQGSSSYPYSFNMSGLKNYVSNLVTGSNTGAHVGYVNGDQEIFPSSEYQYLDITGGGVKTITGEVKVKTRANFNGGLVAIGNNFFVFENTATVGASPSFDATNMLLVDTTPGSGFAVRKATADADMSGFLLPVGTNGVYSPVVINSLSAGVYGSGAGIGVKPVLTTSGSGYGDYITRGFQVISLGISGVTDFGASFGYSEPSERVGVPAYVKNYISGNPQNMSGGFVDTINGVFGMAASSGNTLVDGLYLAEEGLPTTMVGISLSSYSQCAGSSYMVNYTATGYFQPGNVLKAQISLDQYFLNGIITIGTLTTTSPVGSFATTIPGYVYAANYYVRVLADLPATSASVSGLAITNVNVDFSSGLQAYYPFDNSTNDVSGNGYNASLSGGTSYVSDLSGNPTGAVQLDGVNGYIDLGNPAAFQFTTATGFTISTRFKFDGSSATNALLFSYGDNNGYSVELTGSGSTRSLSYYTGGDMLGTGTILEAGRWYTLAATFSNNNMVFAQALYLDGDQVDGQNVAANFSYGASQFYIGRNDAGTKYMSGVIDDFKVFNRELSYLEISSLNNVSSICSGDDVELKVANLSGATYFWASSSGSFTPSANVYNPTVTGMAVGTQTASLVIHQNGCTSPTAVTTVTVRSLPVYSVAPLNTVACYGTTVPFTATGIGNTYNWSAPPLATLSSTAGANVDIVPTTTGSVNLTVTGTNGCFITTSTGITVINTVVGPSIFMTVTPYCYDASLAWFPITSATGYTLQLSTTSGMADIVAGFNNVSFTGNNFSVAGINPGTPYYYRVATLDVCGQGSYSSIQNFTTPGLPVDPVFSYPAFNCQNLAISLPPTGTFAGGSFSATPAVTGLSTLTGAFIPSLNSSGSYAVAYNIAAYGSCPAKSYVTTVQLTPTPPVPASLSNIDNSCSSITFGWGSVSGADFYKLSVSTSASLLPALSAYNAITQTGTALTVSGLSIGTTYYYGITAGNACGYGPQAMSNYTTVSNPIASVFNFGTGLVCNNASTLPVTVSGVSGGLFDISPAIGINTFTGAILPGTFTGSAIVTYTRLGCTPIPTSVPVSITGVPVIQSVAPSTAFYGYTLSVDGQNFDYVTSAKVGNSCGSCGSTAILLSNSYSQFQAQVTTVTSLGLQTVTATNICGTGSSSPLNVSVAGFAVTSLAITGPSVLSVLGGSLNLVSVPTPSYATNPSVNWSVVPLASASISGSGVLQALDNGVVTVTAISVSNPNISALHVVTVTNQLVISTSTVASGMCAGLTFNLSFKTSGTFLTNVYAAQLSNALGSFANPVFIGSVAGVNPISVTLPSSLVAGTGYRIRVFNPGDNVIGYDNGKNIDVTPLPFVNPVATQTICGFQSVNIPLSSSIAGASFSWVVAAADFNISGVGGGSGTAINQSIYGYGNVTYQAFGTLNGCISPAQDMPVVVKRVPSVDAVSSQSLCSGNVLNISLSGPASGTVFSWSVASVTGTISGYSTGTGATIVKTLTGSGSFRYVVTPTLVGCTGSSIAIPVTVLPVPKVNLPIAAVEPTLCWGQDGVVRVSGSQSGFTYQAYNGTTPVGNSSDGNGTNIYLTVPGTLMVYGNNVYNVKVSSTGCGTSTLTSTAGIYAFNTPSSNRSVSGPSDVCIGTVATLSITGSELGVLYTVYTGAQAVSKVLTGTGGNLFTNITTSSLPIGSTVFYGTALSPGCALVVTLAGSATVNLNQVPVIDLIQNVQACSGVQVAVPITSNPSGINYSWTVAQVTGSVSGQSAGSGLSMLQTLTGKGTVKYNVFGVSNSCSASGVTAVVSVVSAPVVSYSLKADSVCSGADALVTLSGSEFGVAYAALLNPSTVDVSIGTGSALLITVPSAGFTSGLNVVTITADNGVCPVKPLTAKASVYVIATPIEPVISSNSIDSLAPCDKENVVLSVAGIYKQYQWLRNGASIVGAVSNTYMPLVDGTYGINVFETSRCSVKSGDFPLTLNSNVAKPVITGLGTSGKDTVLESSQATTYQWYFGKKAIIGATQQKYTLLYRGTYRVRIDGSDKCSQYSDEYVVSNTALDSISRDSYTETDTTIHFNPLLGNPKLTLYPNPTTGDFKLEYSTYHASGNVQIEIYNAYGTKIYTDEGSLTDGSLKTSISLPELAHGVYLVTVLDKDNKTVKTLMLY